METHSKAGTMDPRKEIVLESVMDAMFAQEKKPDVYLDEKALDSGPQTSESDGDSAYVYERENMARDETGRIVVETSELAITALHVDDDPSLSPWTFRTFFLGMSYC
jgi:hypothetical protein